MTPVAAPPKIPDAHWVRHLGTGGFADVHLYRQTVPERDVAVKVLRRAGGEEVEAAFRAEVNLMARMSSHPAVVSVFGAGVSDDGRQYIVMEYCPPPNLWERSRRRVFPVADSLDIGIRLAGALVSLHREGILHRDIKPSNVLFTRFGYPVLADFGLAGSLVDSRLVAGKGFSMAWAPPEQHAPNAKLGVGVDVYSLAATLYLMLSGRAPFEAPGGDNREAAMLVRIKRQAVPAIDRAEVPQELQRVLEIALAKCPEQRYGSMLEFAKSLQQVQVGLRQKMTPIDLLHETAPAAGLDDGLPETRAPILVVNRPPSAAQPRSASSPAPRRAAPEEPDAGLSPEAAGGHQKALRTVLLGAMLLALVVAGGAVLAALLGGGTTPLEDEPHPGESAAVLPVAAVAPVAELSGERRDGEVEFTWTHADEAVTFLYRVLDPLGATEVVATAESAVTVPEEPGRTCLEVVAKRSDGASSVAQTACVDTP